MLCFALLCCAVLCCACPAVLCFALLWYALLCCVVRCDAVLCCAMLGPVVLCCVMLCFVLLCCVVLCYGMLYPALLCGAVWCWVSGIREQPKSPFRLGLVFQKGAGYHLDLLLVGVIIGICSILGLPWVVAATVLSVGHVQSLFLESSCTAPGEKPRFLGVR